jgi:hypothetical protein
MEYGSFLPKPRIKILNSAGTVLDTLIATYNTSIGPNNIINAVVNGMDI